MSHPYKWRHSWMIKSCHIHELMSYRHVLYGCHIHINDVIHRMEAPRMHRMECIRGESLSLNGILWLAMWHPYVECIRGECEREDSIGGDSYGCDIHIGHAYMAWVRECDRNAREAIASEANARGFASNASNGERKVRAIDDSNRWHVKKCLEYWLFCRALLQTRPQ